MILDVSTAFAQLRETGRLATDIYHQRAGMAYYAYVRRDLLEQLHSRAARKDPYPIYERIRAAGPVSKSRVIEWVSPSWELCRQVLRDKRFGMHPAEAATHSQDVMMSFHHLNPPDHTRLRRLVSPAFGPRQMDGYRQRAETVGNRLLDALEGRPFDLVSDFATPYSITLVAELLGIPEDRWAAFAAFAAVLGTSFDGASTVRHARELDAANAALQRLFIDLFALRRREPTDDIISAIVAAEGAEITPDEMVPMCSMLLLAGFDSSANMIGNGVLALLANHDQWDALRADPSLASGATDESLRYDSPVQQAMRYALEDVEIGGVVVRKGERFVNLIGAANRDPERFDAPATFDIRRRDAHEHLSFSAGIHFCLGHALARLEGEVAFATLAQRLPTLHLTGRVVRRSATTLRGPTRMPVNA